MLKSISHPIIDIDTMSIKLVVSLDRKKCWSIFESNGSDYGTLSFIPAIVIQYKSTTWSRSNSIYINRKNIFKMKNDLKLYYNKILQSSDTYIYDNQTDEVVQVDNSSKSKHIIYLGNGQYISLQPSIVYDKENNSLPGVLLCINIIANAVSITIDEYESFMNIFETTNLTSESLQLFNSYLAISNMNTDQMPLAVDKPKTNIKKPVITGSIFQKPKPSESSDGLVEGTQIQKPPTDLNAI